MKINVHIERLVLEGLPYEGRDAAHLQAAFKAGLVRLLADTPWVGRLAQGRAVDRVHAAPVGLAPWKTAEAVGREIAASVHGGLRK